MFSKIVDTIYVLSSSRKVIVALVGVIAEVAAALGHSINPEGMTALMVAIGAIVSVVIGAIAHEDAAEKSQVNFPPVHLPDTSNTVSVNGQVEERVYRSDVPGMSATMAGVEAKDISQ